MSLLITKFVYFNTSEGIDMYGGLFLRTRFILAQPVIHSHAARFTHVELHTADHMHDGLSTVVYGYPGRRTDFGEQIATLLHISEIPLGEALTLRNLHRVNTRQYLTKHLIYTMPERPLW